MRGARHNVADEFVISNKVTVADIGTPKALGNAIQEN